MVLTVSSVGRRASGRLIVTETEIRGPRCSFSIHGHFTCQTNNLVYCISCNRCPTILYIGETGRNLRSRFSEHLRSVRNNTPGFPVTQHFNSAGYSISDIPIRGLQLCHSTNLQRKQREMKLIFQLGTVQPDGLNINFNFKNDLMHSRAHRHSSARFLQIAYFNGFLHTEEGFYTRSVCDFLKNY